MNIARALTALKKINAQLQRKQYCSAEQLRVLRKARAKWNRQLKQFIDPNAPARPLPNRKPETGNQLTFI